MYTREKIKKSIQKELEKATNLEITKKNLEKPPEPSMGDLSTSIAFKYAEKKEKDPVEAAEEIKKMINPNMIDKIETKGPYINFHVKKEKYYPEILKEAEQKNYGKSSQGEGKTVIVEYSSPNIAKPFHIGHLRSTIIGESLKNIYKYLGYETIAINHLGDWGTQFGKIITAYNKWGDPEKLEKDPIQHLFDLYVKFHEEAEKNPEIEDEARKNFKKLEDGAEREEKLWEKFRELSIKKFKETYRRLGVEFDSYRGEAHYVRSGKSKQIVKEALEKNIAEKEEEGAIVIPLEEHGLTNMIVQKEDGATIYPTRDLAAAKHRWRENNFHENLYVVGSEQNLHFKQVFKTLELLGYDWSDKCKHLSYGMVQLPEGSMSTRKGKVVKLEDVLDEAQERSIKAIEEKNPSLEDKEEVADEVGKAALIFINLNQRKNKDIKFTWEKALNFEGDTGPYLQYAHARASGIIKETQGRELEQTMKIKEILKDEEISEETENLIKKIAEFPEKIKESQEQKEPQQITSYLVELSHKFMDFYRECPVKQEKNKKLKSIRLKTVKAFKNTLARGLELLEIKPLEEM